MFINLEKDRKKPTDFKSISVSGVASRCRPSAALVRQLVSVAIVLVSVLSAHASDPVPVPVPAGARELALSLKPEWIEAADRNPVFYNVEIGMDLSKVAILDGYANVMIIDADVVRFAESGDDDPVKFATRTLFEFPMLVEGVYVGSLVIRPRSAADANTTGDYVFSGITDPGGGLDPVVERFGGYTRCREFSVISFIGEPFAGVFLRTATDGRVQFAPVNPEAESLFSDSEVAAPVPADRAARHIRTRILERVHALDKTRE